MFFDFLVIIPDVSGIVVTERKQKSDAKKKAYYVLFEYERRYNKKKKYTQPMRVCIGRLPRKGASQMYPNENYFKYFPSAVMPEERETANRSCCLRLGTYAVIDSVLRSYGIDAMLEKILFEDAGLFMDLVAYLVINEENAAQYYPDYAFCHPLFTANMRIKSDSAVSRLFSDVTTDQIIAFLDEWNKERDHRERIYISYDSTNKNSQAGDIDIVEFGKAKVDCGLPIFNISLAFDKTNRVPLFYEEYPGSINDIAQLTYMVDKAMEYNYRHVGFILDRGYFSQGNIRYMDENGFPFVIMVKGHKELVRAIVEEKRLSFESKRDGLIDGYYIYSTTVQRRIFESDKTTRFIHLYFNPKKMSAEREQIEIKITRLKEFLKKVENKQVTLGAPFTEYFKLHYDKDGVFLFAEERQEVIERELELAGYFTIISSENMTAETAYRLYKGRDVSEKLFRADKTFLGSRSARVHSRKSLATKNLIEFIALIVRNRIYNLLKEETLRVGIKQNFMTVPAAIRELEKIEMVRRNNGLYRLDHAVTRTQRIILSAFGLTPEDIRKKAHEIALKLSENEQTPQPEEEQDDGEDEITDID